MTKGMTKHELEQMVKTLVEENQRLQHRIAELEQELAKARKSSKTSSKPPSSDIAKPHKTPQTPSLFEPRNPGGQPGHPKHARAEFSPDEITGTIEYTLSSCPTCGGGMTPAEQAPRVIQQVEIVESPLRIEEHRGLAYWCPTCQRIHYAPFPATVSEGGLCGPRVTALVAYMKGACHASFSTIRKFLRDVVKVQVSRGYLRTLIAKVSDALEPAFEELLRALPEQDVVNIDETGHKDNGDRFWTWCFKASMYTLFRIDTSRGSQVLLDVLGEEFDGLIGCDYFSAYRKYMRLNEKVTVQFCLAHVIRDIKYLMTVPDADTRCYGECLRDAFRSLFEIIHRGQKQEWAPYTLQHALEVARDRILTLATTRVPSTSDAQNMAKRFATHGDSFFQFITYQDWIEPTNNLAEQAIRFVVIDRRITQGTRSQSGRAWCERIWTVMATCTQRGMDVFDFLYRSLCAHWTQAAGPSLLPVPPALTLRDDFG
jgi:transposase